MPQDRWRCSRSSLSSSVCATSTRSRSSRKGGSCTTNRLARSCSALSRKTYSNGGETNARYVAQSLHDPGARSGGDEGFLHRCGRLVGRRSAAAEFSWLLAVLRRGADGASDRETAGGRTPQGRGERSGED